ncbi:MAG: C1 family peptidase [Bacteroidales bacterium]|jgi:bleomycin hydrolase|nr:C1 family peptidase [Bacteroidales bacterium]
MKKYIVFLFMMSFVGSIYAQNGTLNETVIQEIRGSYDNTDPDNKALMNAISNNKINDLAINRNNVGKVDHHFKYKVNVTGITNQESSGRCWMFTSLNSLRPEVIEKYNLSDFRFSENYLYFWDMMEKSNLFFEAVIENSDKPMDDRKNDWLFSNPIGDGGVWNSFSNLVEKYGLVPASAMPETHHSSNTAFLRKILKRKLREQALELRELAKTKASAEQIQAQKTEMLQAIYRILALSLGEPPTEFSYRFIDKDGKIGATKTYTPLSFYNALLPEYSPKDYVMLMNDPTREYYKLYEIEYDRNVMEGKNWTYINLPNDKFKQFAVASIKANEGMYASCDVGKQLSKDAGTLDMNNFDYGSLYGVDFTMDKRERIISKESGSSHAMLLMAVDVDENENPTKWQFENSWGPSYGNDGYLSFTDEWFNEYMFRLVIHKKFLDKSTLKVLDQKPIKLPPWDPMFMQDK